MPTESGVDDLAQPGPLATDLRMALNRLIRKVRSERADERVTDSQFGVLATLAHHGAMTAAALAEHQHVAPPPMTRTIQTLVAAGLVVKDADLGDRRQMLVSLTEAGRAEVAETRRRRDQWLALRLADLTSDERALLARTVTILDRIVAR